MRARLFGFFCNLKRLQRHHYTLPYKIASFGAALGLKLIPSLPVYIKSTSVENKGMVHGVEPACIWDDGISFRNVGSEPDEPSQQSHHASQGGWEIFP